MTNHELGPGIGLMRSIDKPFTQPPDALLDGFLATHANVNFVLRTYTEIIDTLEATGISDASFNGYLHNVLHLGSKGYASAIKSVLSATTPDINSVDVFGSSSLIDYERKGEHEDSDYDVDMDLEIGEIAVYEYAQLVEALTDSDLAFARAKLDFITHIFAVGGENSLQRQNIFLFLENRLRKKKATDVRDTGLK